MYGFRHAADIGGGRALMGAMAGGVAALVLLVSCETYSTHVSGGPEPDDFPIHGIDVARYQGTIDWQRVRQDNVQFAFIKATEGGDHHDSAFLVNWLAARDAGVPRGAYHFYYFCRPVEEQFAWFIKHVPVDPAALPPVLDMEWNAHSKTCNKRPPREKVLRDMRYFLQAAERHYGKKPIIYTSVDFHEDILDGALPEYPFWVRSVAGYPTLKYNDRKWFLWQYTATGNVRGIDGNVDRNVFAGDRREWMAWLRGEKDHPEIHRF